MEVRCINYKNKKKFMDILNNIPENSFQIIFYNEAFSPMLKEIYQGASNKKNTIFILIDNLSCFSKNQVIQVLFPSNYFFQLIFETDLDFALSEIKVNQNFKSLFIVSNIIYNLEGQDFLFDIYSLFGFQKKYSGIVIKKQKRSCFYNNQFYENYVLLIFNKKKDNLNLIKDFWTPIEDKEFIINKSLKDGYAQINWLDVFEFYKQKFNLRSMSRIEERINQIFLSFSNIKNINYLIKQKADINLSTEQVFTDIAIHSFQFCKIVSFNEDLFFKNIINKKEKKCIFFIDNFIFNKIKNKLPEEDIFIGVDLFITQKENELPFLTEGALSYFTKNF